MKPEPTQNKSAADEVTASDAEVEASWSAPGKATSWHATSCWPGIGLGSGG